MELRDGGAEGEPEAESGTVEDFASAAPFSPSSPSFPVKLTSSREDVERRRVVNNGDFGNGFGLVSSNGDTGGESLLSSSSSFLSFSVESFSSFLSSGEFADSEEGSVAFGVVGEVVEVRFPSVNERVRVSPGEAVPAALSDSCAVS